MATEDVPGANPGNHDDLHVGCWAEHQDGSLLYVKGLENGRVVYELFDMAEEPPQVLPDAMTEAAFKQAFSRGGKSGATWTWHDKTTFPWDRVMGTFKPRVGKPSVEDEGNAARRAAERLGRRRGDFRDVDRDEIADLMPQVRGVATAGARYLLKRIQDAIGRQDPGR